MPNIFDIVFALPWEWNVAIVFWLLVRVKPLNRLCAKLLGAPPGRSLSAHLWAMEVTAASYSTPLHPSLIGGLAGVARWFVDAVFWVFLGQSWHCKAHFDREAA